MAKQIKNGSGPKGTYIQRDARSGRFLLGRATAKKLNAIEGVTVGKAGSTRAEEFDRRGLSAEERRRTVIGAFRPKG